MSDLRERIEGLVARLRDEAKNLIENGRDSQDIAIFNALAIEKLTTAEGLESLLAAALVAEGQADFALPEQRDLTPVEQAALRRVYAKLYKPVAAAPSLHKETRNMNYLADLRHDLQDEEFALAYLSACAKEGDDTLRIGIRDVRAALHKEGLARPPSG